MCWSLLVELKHIFQGVVRNVIQQGLINKDTKVTLLKIFIDHNFINNFQKIKDHIHVRGDFEYPIPVYHSLESTTILNVILSEYHKEKSKL